MKRFRGEPEKEVGIARIIAVIVMYMLTVTFVMVGLLWLGLKLFS